MHYVLANVSERVMDNYWIVVQEPCNKPGDDPKFRDAAAAG